jgi:hypothetical protein
MRQTTLLVTLFVAFLVAFATPMMAIVQTPTDVSSPTLTVTQQEAKASFTEKIKGLKSKYAQKVSDFFKVKADFKDGTKKWLWFALVLFLASVVLYAIGQSLLANLASAGTTVCLVIWLLKYLEVM